MLVDPILLDNELVDFPYPFDIENSDTQITNGNSDLLLTLEPRRMWHCLLDDISNNTALPIIASRFHAGLINAIAAMVKFISEQHAFNTVALSGGCLQNQFLLEGLSEKLESEGWRCLSHSQVPSNDGGISLGQAVIAAARLLKKQSIK